MPSLRKLLPLSIGAVALFLASCGGSDAEPLSKSEYLKQGNAICKAAGERVNKAFEAVGEIDPADLGEDAGKIADFFEETAAIFSGMIDDLDDLEPPSDDKGDVDEMLKTGRDGVDELRGAAEKIEEDGDLEALDDMGENLDEFDEKADEYGLDECSLEAS